MADALVYEVGENVGNRKILASTRGGRTGTLGGQYRVVAIDTRSKCGVARIKVRALTLRNGRRGSGRNHGRDKIYGGERGIASTIDRSASGNRKRDEASERPGNALRK